MTTARLRRQPRTEGNLESLTKRRSLRSAFGFHARVLLSSALAFAVVGGGLIRQPAITTLCGLWLMLGASTVVWLSLLDRAIPSRLSRCMIAVGLAIATALGTALAVNTLLPLFGVATPLRQGWLATASLVAVLVLMAVDRRLVGSGRQCAWPGRAYWRGLGPVAALGGLSVLCTVAGALRLNNGYDSSVSLASLISTAALIVLLVVRRDEDSDGVTAIGLYLAAASLLLLTSLRGSYITGHDIQAEFRFFRLAALASHWDVSQVRSAYNACLSVTLLPVSLSRLTAVPAVYVFKVVLPLLFALTPVLVYCSCRNAASKLVALLSAVFFMAFPTFFSDMPFMVRQEVAFLFLGCAVLVLTEHGGPIVARRITFVALLCAVVVSHYSTAYLVLAGLAASLLTWHLVRALPPVWRWIEHRAGSQSSGLFVRWWMVAMVTVATVFWNGPATHINDQLSATLSEAVEAVRHPGTETGSSDTRYIFFAPHRPSGQERLDAYADRVATRTQETRRTGRLEPLSVVEKSFASPAAKEPAAFPPTPLGRALESRGVDLTALNAGLRWINALLLQVLLLAGLVSVVIGRTLALRPPFRDLFVLAVGSMAMIALQTVLAPLSIEYGVLRSFQQSLFFLAPFIALGSLHIMGPKFRWPLRAAVCFALCFYLNTTGVVAAVLGGGPAKLQLDNRGLEYDIYFDHEQERSAFTWLGQRVESSRRQRSSSSIQTDRFTFERMPVLLRSHTQGNNFPTLIRKSSYVLLGSTTVRKNQATLVLDGDLVTYSYPVELLNSTKNKVYSSTGASVYSPGDGG